MTKVTIQDWNDYTYNARRLTKQQPDTERPTTLRQRRQPQTQTDARDHSDLQIRCVETTDAIAYSDGRQDTYSMTAKQLQSLHQGPPRSYGRCRGTTLYAMSARKRARSSNRLRQALTVHTLQLGRPIRKWLSRWLAVETCTISGPHHRGRFTPQEVHARAPARSDTTRSVRPRRDLRNGRLMRVR